MCAITTCFAHANVYEEYEVAHAHCRHILVCAYVHTRMYVLYVCLNNDLLVNKTICFFPLHSLLLTVVCHCPYARKVNVYFSYTSTYIHLYIYCINMQNVFASDCISACWLDYYYFFLSLQTGMHI